MRFTLNPTITDWRTHFWNKQTDNFDFASWRDEAVGGAEADTCVVEVSCFTKVLGAATEGTADSLFRGGGNCNVPDDELAGALPAKR